jgi:hypothetical protein
MALQTAPNWAGVSPATGELTSGLTCFAGSSCHGCILGSRIRNVKGVAPVRDCIPIPCWWLVHAISRRIETSDSTPLARVSRGAVVRLMLPIPHLFGWCKHKESNLAGHSQPVYSRRPLHRGLCSHGKAPPGVIRSHLCAFIPSDQQGEVVPGDARRIIHAR